MGTVFAELRLAWRLMREPRVALVAKALPVLAALYVVSPLDFIPDVLPVLGQMDDLGILILSGMPEEQFAVGLIRQGASGYLSKTCEPEEIVKAIRAIGQGHRYISSTVAELLAQEMTRKDGAVPHEALSEREFSVFLRLAAGKSSGEISKELFLSPKTVSTYRTRLMEKLGLHSNSDLTYYAIKHNLIG